MHTRQIRVGSVLIGGGAPVTVQTMATASPSHYDALLSQVRSLSSAGADIVRLAVPDMEAVRVFGRVREAVAVPLVADIHFDYRLAVEAAAAGADKIRINPGNIGSADRVKAVADACRERSVPIRIGVNGGSLAKEILAEYGGPTPEALLASAVAQARMLERYDFTDICLSLKASGVPTTVKACRLASQTLAYPLHLGVTEVGGGRQGLIKSAAGIGGLLADGVGDTIRVSLTGDPHEEIRAGRDILQAVGMGDRVDLVSCPTCGRCKTPVAEVYEELERALASLTLPKGRRMTVAVMGCAVNGPGEAREADLGVAGGDDEWLLFRKGKIVGKERNEGIADRLLREIEALLSEDEEKNDGNDRREVP